MVDINGVNKATNNYYNKKQATDSRLEYPCDQQTQTDSTKNYIFHASVIYSQNLGFLDPQHSQGYFHNFLRLYSEINKSIQEGEDRNISIQAGSGLTKNIIHVQLKVSELVGLNDNQSKFHIIKSILADISYRYEQNTELLGGFGNHVGSLIGMGSSSFSTEDLTANGLGMMFAEEYITSPKEFMEKYGHNAEDVADVNKYKTRSRAVNTAIISVAGKVWPKDPSNQIKIKVFGSKSFLPERSPLIKTNDFNSKAIDYLIELETIRLTKGNMPGRGMGWEVRGEDKGIIATLP